MSLSESLDLARDHVPLLNYLVVPPRQSDSDFANVRSKSHKKRLSSKLHQPLALKVLRPIAFLSYAFHLFLVST